MLLINDKTYELYYGNWELLNLLNKYEKTIGGKGLLKEWTFYDHKYHRGELWGIYSELLLISKEFGFIHRLLKEDKIDTHKARIYTRSMICVNGNDIIKYLSISDTPIQDLVDLLK